MSVLFVAYLLLNGWTDLAEFFVRSGVGFCKKILDQDFLEIRKILFSRLKFSGNIANTNTNIFTLKTFLIFNFPGAAFISRNPEKFGFNHLSAYYTYIIFHI